MLISFKKRTFNSFISDGKSVGESLKDKDDDLVSVKIPKRLFEKLRGKMSRADSEMVRKYIIYVLEREASSKQEEVYSEEDRKRIKERLRRLGYF